MLKVLNKHTDWYFIIIIMKYSLELNIRGGHCSPYTYPQAIRMIDQNKIPLEVQVKMKDLGLRFEAHWRNGLWLWRGLEGAKTDASLMLLLFAVSV